MLDLPSFLEAGLSAEGFSICGRKKESFGIERVYDDCYYWFCIGGIKRVI